MTADSPRSSGHRARQVKALVQPAPTSWQQVTVGPAHPVPGEMRDGRRAVAAAAIARSEAAISAALRDALKDQCALVVGRLRGRKARQGTRHWVSDRPLVEIKAVDAGYVLPTRAEYEVVAAVKPVVARQLADAIGAQVSLANYGGSDGIGVQSSIVQDAIAAEITRLTGLVGADADRIRKLISDKDASGADLDELVRSIEGAYDADPLPDEGARLVTIGGMNGGSIEVARAAGVSLKQWLSRRDPKVRDTHDVADGQVKGLDQPFTVGAFNLQYPGDDSEWPASAPEVANCRCTMIFSKPPKIADARSWQRQPDTATLRLRAQRELDRMLATDAAAQTVHDQTNGPRPTRLRAPLVVFTTVAPQAIAGAEVGSTVTIGQATTFTPLAATAAAQGGTLVQVDLPAGAVVAWVPGTAAVSLPAGSSYEVLARTGDQVTVRAIVPS